MKDHHLIGVLAAALLALCAAGIAYAGVGYSESEWQLVTASGTKSAKSYADCIAQWRSLAPPVRQRTDYCRQRLVTKIVADPPAPPACTAPKPADELRATACPNTDTKWWNQERTYVAAPYPACWTATEWVPTGPGPSECLPAPPDPTPEPIPTGNVFFADPPIADMSKLAPGDTLVLHSGTYTSLKLKACSAEKWCTVRAGVDGAVTFNGLSIGAGAWYTSIEGVKFTGSGQKAITGSFLKLKRCAFVGGPTSGNNVIVQIGTNDRTPGADHVLVEDSWVYGPGGRYKVLVYNATNVVLRRVVTRTDAGYKNSDGAPEADITVYDSRNVEVQNAIALDGQGSGAYVAVFYNAINGGTSTPNATRAWRGNIAINGSGYYMGTEGQASITGLVVEDGAAFGGKYGISQLKGTGNVYRRITLVNVKGDGFGIFGGSASVADSVIVGQTGKAFNGASCSSCVTGTSAAAVGLKSLIEGVNSKGAQITHRIGVAGTLYGEPGFNELTAEPLWPWPNEERIKADFDSVRPAFGGKSLTEYVGSALQ